MKLLLLLTFIIFVINTGVGSSPGLNNDIIIPAVGETSLNYHIEKNITVHHSEYDQKKLFSHIY